jgi:DNA-binding CsgD family transcriptional regulator
MIETSAPPLVSNPAQFQGSPSSYGRGERKRPSSGWASLTPTERDVVELVSEGLGNKDIATRLFVSLRTVQTHLTHVYAKLGLTSRVQLVQEAARHR